MCHSLADESALNEGFKCLWFTRTINLLWCESTGGALLAARMCVLPDSRTNSRPQSHPTWSANKLVGARFLSQCEVRASRLTCCAISHLIHLFLCIRIQFVACCHPECIKMSPLAIKLTLKSVPTVTHQQ